MKTTNFTINDETIVNTLEILIKVTCEPKTSVSIGSGKGRAMGVQPHLILRVLQTILIFIIEIFSLQYISPT